MGPYPNYQTYRELYERYYSNRKVEELLELLDPLHGTRLLDLCCGDGNASAAALADGVSSVTLVDAEPAMIPPSLQKHGRIRVFIGDVNRVLSTLYTDHKLFDRVVCRQAINYWLRPETVERLARVMVPGGIFAFNTFNQKPPEKPRSLQYELKGKAFVEVSWLIDETVHHVQMREGLQPHYTTFQWLSPERLHSLLEPRFSVTEDRREKTSLYRCVKK